VFGQFETILPRVEPLLEDCQVKTPSCRVTPICHKKCTAPLFLFAAVVIEVSTLQAAEPNPRIVFNDDAQVLSEAPRKGTSKFVMAWLDRESEAVPFTTLVFLAATPDVCTFDSNAGEVYGDRFGETFGKGGGQRASRDSAPRGRMYSRLSPNTCMPKTNRCSRQFG